MTTAFSRQAQQAIRSIDPSAFQTEPVGGRDICAQALSYVENALAPDTQRGQFGKGRLEMRPIRLVGTDEFRRNHRVEPEVEVTAGAFERRIIDVAQRADLGAGLERHQAIMAVRISGPLMRRDGKGLTILRIDGNTELGGNTVEAPAQCFGIEVRGALLLDLRAGAIERHQKIVS